MNRRFFRYYYLRFLRLQGNPGEIARGVAIGTFIGITPTIPLHTVLILLVTVMLRASKVAGIVASYVVSNPFTFFIQYYLSWRIGNWLMPYDLSWEQVHSIMAVISGHSDLTTTLTAISKLGWQAASVMVVGGSVLALPFTMASYLYALTFFRRLRRKRQQRINKIIDSYENN